MEKMTKAQALNLAADHIGFALALMNTSAQPCGCCKRMVYEDYIEAQKAQGLKETAKKLRRMAEGLARNNDQFVPKEPEVDPLGVANGA